MQQQVAAWEHHGGSSRAPSPSSWRIRSVGGGRSRLKRRPPPPRSCSGGARRAAVNSPRGGTSPAGEQQVLRSRASIGRVDLPSLSRLCIWRARDPRRARRRIQPGGQLAGGSQWGGGVSDNDSPRFFLDPARVLPHPRCTSPGALPQTLSAHVASRPACAGESRPTPRRAVARRRGRLMDHGVRQSPSQLLISACLGDQGCPASRLALQRAPSSCDAHVVEAACAASKRGSLQLRTAQPRPCPGPGRGAARQVLASPRSSFSGRRRCEQARHHARARRGVQFGGPSTLELIAQAGGQMGRVLVLRSWPPQLDSTGLSFPLGFCRQQDDSSVLSVFIERSRHCCV
ncbi:hypothetical protein FQR65_LT20491 [Abscondita terminalis]|nr:hypothetical protein FQR65_LT20491 [Abscondita terminalis]